MGRISAVTGQGSACKRPQFILGEGMLHVVVEAMVEDVGSFLAAVNQHGRQVRDITNIRYRSCEMASSDIAFTRVASMQRRIKTSGIQAWNDSKKGRPAPRGSRWRGHPVDCMPEALRGARHGVRHYRRACAGGSEGGEDAI